MRVYADNRTGDSAASTVGGIDGVPFLPLFRGQAAVEIIELQLNDNRDKWQQSYALWHSSYC